MSLNKRHHEQSYIYFIQISLIPFLRIFSRAFSDVINESGMTLSPVDVKSYLVATVCTESIVSSLKQGKHVD